MTDIQQLWREEVELDERLQAIDAKRVARNATIGRAMLSAHRGGDDGTDVLETIGRLDREALALEQAIEECRKQRADAIREFYRSEGGPLREQATQLRGESGQAQAEQDELLRPLEEATGCSWIPDQKWKPRGPGAARGFETIKLPRAEFLRQQAEELEREATEKENRSVSMSGSATGDSAQEAFRMAVANPMIIAPRLSELRAWAAEPHEARSRDNVVEISSSMEWRLFYDLRWSNGEIDADSSGLFRVAQKKAQEPAA